MLIGLSATCLLALGGCGQKEIDADKVERFILDETRVPDAVETVACPEGVEVEEGNTFDCKIVATNGSEEAVTIEQQDDEGTVAIVGNRQTKLPENTEDLTIIPENVEALIRGAAEDDVTIVSVDCPPDVPLEEGRSFECLVRFDDEREERVEITQRDELGNVEITGSRPLRDR